VSKPQASRCGKWLRRRTAGRDRKRLEPAPDEAKWTVVSGPVTTIAADGSAAAGSVYQNISATVRGTYAGVSATLVVAVLNLTSDDFRLSPGSRPRRQSSSVWWWPDAPTACSAAPI
jgi:hypothetical protein